LVLVDGDGKSGIRHVTNNICDDNGEDEVVVLEVKSGSSDGMTMAAVAGTHG
jgi:hypothetical protein